MRRILQVVSWLALVGTMAPAVLFYLGKIELESVSSVMLGATVVWFVAAFLGQGNGDCAEPTTMEQGENVL